MGGLEWTEIRVKKVKEKSMFSLRGCGGLEKTEIRVKESSGKVLSFAHFQVIIAKKKSI